MEFFCKNETNSKDINISGEILYRKFTLISYFKQTDCVYSHYCSAQSERKAIRMRISKRELIHRDIILVHFF